MSLYKYVILYRKIDELIKLKKTGSPKELAEKLEISERQLYNYLNDLRKLDGKHIEYSSRQSSYIYN